MTLSLHSPYALLSEFNNGVLVMGMVERFGMGRPWVGQVGMWARLPLCLHHRHYRQVGLSGLQVSQGNGVASGWVDSFTGDHAFLGCCFPFWWVSPVVSGIDKWRPMWSFVNLQELSCVGPRECCLRMQEVVYHIPPNVLWPQYMFLRNNLYIEWRMTFTLVCTALVLFI